MPQIFKIGSYTVYFWSNEGKLLNRSMSILQKDARLLPEPKYGSPVLGKLSSQKIPQTFRLRFYGVS